MRARLPLGMIIGIILLLAFIGFSIAAYRSQWKWAGFSDKTVWDWLTLLFVPIAVGLGVYLLDQRQKARDRWLEQQREQERERDKQQEAALQAYIDNMSKLITEQSLREPPAESDVQNIARVRTLTVLPLLDSKRKGIVLQFLYEANLISTPKPIIDLTGANLSGVILSEILKGFQLREANLPRTDFSGASLVLTDLSRANLNGADLEGANLSLASLYETNLRRANLRRANLRRANLERTDLAEADLSLAIFSEADLSEADLSGANLRKAWLQAAKLQGTNLSKTNLANANLRGAEMTNKTDLSEAILEGAKYNNELIQDESSKGVAYTIKPTDWPQGFDPKDKKYGLNFDNRKTSAITVSR